MAPAGGRLSEEDREELIRAWPWPEEAATTEHGFEDVAAAVERILASRLAAAEQRVAEARAEAWDEGFTKAGRLLTGLDHEDWPPPPNPYREATTEGGA